MYGFPIAMAYVPRQEWHRIYEAEEALQMGTLFNELNLPFNHSDCGNGCGCR
ncbi:MAG: spore coat associated protein CotJA [Ruminococcaceae bacterium]|nr:spore coat associated protein CotJA [Oscillospiraceae bacterium]